MSARCFVDTNVAVYLYDDDEPTKRDRAFEVFADPARHLVLSAQVLSEFFVTATRKLTTPLDHAGASEAIGSLSALDVVAIDDVLVARAIETSARHQLSYWDALIVEAAVSARSATLLSEDLATGATIRGVTIQNPFAA